MVSRRVRLPNGQKFTASEDFAGIIFKSTNNALPEWTITVAAQNASTAPLTPEPPAVDSERSSKRHCFGTLYTPTLENDSLYISSVSAQNAEFMAPVSTQELALMLYTSLYWYFQQPAPRKTTNPKAAHSTPIAGKPLGEWRVTIPRQGCLEDPEVMAELESMGLVSSMDSTVGIDEAAGWDNMFVTQRMFWQLPESLFLQSSRRHAYPPALMYIRTNGILHPVRPKPPRMGEAFYHRFVPSIGEFISFRVASTSPQPVRYTGPRESSVLVNDHLRAMSDMQLIKRWMAKPRVKEFWGDYTDDFLPVALKTPGSIPVIGLWDGVPFGFFQVYWVKEDILGQHVGGAVADGFDRGLHVFIGEDWARGRVPQWLSSLAHWCFTSENRTMSVCLEPRVDNARFLKRLEENGFYRERQVTFPHKQSWMFWPLSTGIPPTEYSTARAKMGASETCPVDHKAMAAAKPASPSADVCPVDHKAAKPASPSADVCPVDHTAREAWLKQARAASAAAEAAAPSAPAAPSTAASSTAATHRKSWSATLWSYVPFTTSSAPTPPPAPPARRGSALGVDREISTIPRASPATDGQGPVRAGPSNHEVETGADPVSGNWIYPSEKMFFDAMKRKGLDARANDMKTVVPIHNAVNERAWQEIKEWEAPYLAASKCAGPKLHSFAGLSTQLTPRARFNSLLGYQTPFDRHDWVVDRCGQTIDYVIDFYPGKPKPNGMPSFYLDVRPKLNSWEGVKMRFLRGIGVY
ncbi:hypothetical protein TD95_001360 [Thielaviopsis punctulata]|uniref:holocytochrome-c synthase n=1 Tax=Thielaviopsis punctulata TaxID=72032 RepID=A0A0F4ZGP3_9PEZI|nr:hypothetical protein TD95_001360 [Thielaviopsis punctulata]